MKLSSKRQNRTKAIIRGSIYLSILLVFLSITISGVYALPPDKNFGGECTNSPETLSIGCCWSETDEEGIEIEYCQQCGVDTKTGGITGCGEKFPKPFEKNDCLARPQLTCPEGDIPRFEQESPFTKPSDVKDLQEMQPANTNLGSTVGDEGSEQSINEESTGNEFTDSSSQDNSADTEQTSSEDNQNQSSQD